MPFYSCHTCHKTFTRCYHRDRHIQTKHMNASHNCNLCSNTYTHPHDLARHMAKHHTATEHNTSASISAHLSTPTVRDEDIPPDFFRLLEELEDTLPNDSQAVPSSSVNTSTTHSRTKNTSTQTTNTHTLAPYKPKKHQHTNTHVYRKIDKSHTEPLSGLRPCRHTVNQQWSSHCHLQPKTHHFYEYQLLQ